MRFRGIIVELQKKWTQKYFECLILLFWLHLPPTMFLFATLLVNVFGSRVTYFLNDTIGVWFWMYVELGLRILIVQEQPSRVVFKKRCSENMQQIYRRIPIPKCDFNKVASQLYWNRILAWLFSCKFAAYFQNNFP